MIIGGKSALIKKQLKDRSDKGAKYIELHTFYEDFIDINASLKKKAWVKENELEIYCVHAPFKDHLNQHIGLTSSNPNKRKETLNLFKKVITFANAVSDVGNPLVVIHSGGLFEPSTDFPTKEKYMLAQKEIFQKEVLELERFLTTFYPHITVVIENHVKYLNIENEEKHFTYGYEDDISRWIEDLNTNNVGTILDICHSMAVINYNKEFNPNSEFVSQEKFIKAYAPTLKLIHLSKGYNHAIEKNEHGEPFLSSNPEDIEYLKMIFNTLKEVGYEGAITIETIEADINDAVHYLETTQAISKII